MEFFKTITDKKIPLPIFFPDATRAVLKTLDSADIESTHTPGILVNTYHLYQRPSTKIIQKFDGIRNFMAWHGGVISDSGGFQVMSLAKKFGGKNSVSDKGVIFKENNKKILFTPQTSIKFQSQLKTDMIVVLDDFTDLDADYKKARETVERTILWAKICKKEFDKIYFKTDPEKKPYLLGVVQGGNFLDLRKECTERLVKIGFDGLGYGGWPINNQKFNFDVPKVIADNCPKDYLLYGLGIGKPEDIIGCYKLGWKIFDCVLPTRDARHRRLYIYNAKSIDNIDLDKKNFYKYYTPDKEIHLSDDSPISTACDCLLCTRYTKSYLAHLFKIGDMTAGRLATIHNLRFYSLLMEKLRQINSL